MEKEFSIDGIYGTMEWAQECIDTYEPEDFDPLAILMGTESKESKMMCASALYLAEIERLTEEFRKERRRIAMS